MYHTLFCQQPGRLKNTLINLRLRKCFFGHIYSKIIIIIIIIIIISYLYSAPQEGRGTFQVRLTLRKLRLILTFLVEVDSGVMSVILSCGS